MLLFPHLWAYLAVRVLYRVHATIRYFVRLTQGCALAIDASGLR